MHSECKGMAFEAVSSFPKSPLKIARPFHSSFKSVGAKDCADIPATPAARPSVQNSIQLLKEEEGEGGEQTESARAIA